MMDKQVAKWKGRATAPMTANELSCPIMTDHNHSKVVRRPEVGRNMRVAEVVTVDKKISLKEKVKVARR